MKLLIDETELDKEQRAFLDSFLFRDGNELVMGFPGSGKSILLLFAIKRIRKQNPAAKILFIEFTHSLIKTQRAALSELNYEGESVQVETYYDFVKFHAEEQWDYIVCDEVQDVPTTYLQMMKQAAKRVIVGGDANQSIYANDPVMRLSTCQPQDVIQILAPTVTELNIIHRIGKKVANAVNAILPEMKVLTGRTSMVKQNMQIRLWKAKDAMHETQLILDNAIKAVGENESVAILFPFLAKINEFVGNALQHFGDLKWEPLLDKYIKPDFNDLNLFLARHNVPLQVIANGAGNIQDSGKKISITTYHSSKGLDFDKVFLPYCNDYDKLIPDDRLLMVAMTRSRKELIISHSSAPYFSLTRIDPKDINTKDYTVQEEAPKAEEDIFGF